MGIEMKLMLPSKSDWVNNPSLIHVLQLKNEKSPIISVVGAGGKTSTIEYIVNEYNNIGDKAIVSTTTHMFQPLNFAWCKEESMELLEKCLETDNVVWLGIPANHEKMKSPDLSFFDKVKQLNIPLVIESDGSKRLPFKVPAEKEPVILEESDIVIGVLGMDALGRPMKEVCFRYELATKLLDKSEDELITKEDYVSIILNNWGLRKGIKNGMKYIVFLNKVDDEYREKEAMLIRDMLDKCGFHHVYLSSYRI